MTRFLALGLLALTGCVATPLPDPPSLEPPDLDLVNVSPTSIGPAVDITGAAGAVDPSFVVVVVNLDRTDAPVRVDAGADGSFSMNVLGFPGNIVRIHVEMDEARSPPVDFVASGGTPTAFVPPLADCLDIPVDIALGRIAIGSMDTVRVPITNDCADTVQIDAIALRVPTDGLDVRTAPPITVPASAEGTALVDVAPTAAGRVEEVLLLGIASPEVGRRAITLHGTAE